MQGKLIRKDFCREKKKPGIERNKMIKRFTEHDI